MLDLNRVRGKFVIPRRSSDRWVLRGLILGWILSFMSTAFLILVWLDASIAGRVVDLLFLYGAKAPFGN